MNGLLASGLIALTVTIIGLIGIWLTPPSSSRASSKPKGRDRS